MVAKGVGDTITMSDGRRWKIVKDETHRVLVRDIDQGLEEWVDADLVRLAIEAEAQASPPVSATEG